MVMQAFEPGTHASTFGGNPLAASSVIATIHTIMDENIIKNCIDRGKYLYNGLSSLKERYPIIRDIRGMGLIWGIELAIDGTDIVKEFLNEGIIINCTGGNVLRLLPPLIIKDEEIDLFLEIADRIFERRLGKSE
jgi:acetylornithine/succinyldiaminopimelate/putrescine aminotransferase